MPWHILRWPPTRPKHSTSEGHFALAFMHHLAYSMILFVTQVGVPALVVFLNKADLVDDEELLELVELEIREMLNDYQYDGDSVPIVKGSALGALEVS